MGTIRKHEEALLVAGMIARDPLLFAPAAERIAGSFGSLGLESPLLPFEETQYYTKEMGEPLFRKFYGFQDLFDPARLVEVKHFTNALEREEPFGGHSGRRLNIDPGYLTLAKLVLASTKNHAHRLLLGRGIYGEITLSFRKGGFIGQPWTYPDYTRKDYLAFFSAMRESLYRRIDPKQE